MPPVNRNHPRRAGSSESRYSVMEFLREFPDDAACLDYLWRTLYSSDGKHYTCPKCKTLRTFHRVESRPLYSCAKCGKGIHPTAGTIFEKSSTSLHLWFYGIYLMASTRCGISAKQLERELGVTYKTAWRMFNKIRSLLTQDGGEQFGGTVEMDEAYIGGSAKWRSASRSKAKGVRRGRGDPNKQPVFGIVQRGDGQTHGKVYARSSQGRESPTCSPTRRSRCCRVRSSTRTSGVPTTALVTQASTTPAWRMGRRSTWTETSTRTPWMGSGPT